MSKPKFPPLSLFHHSPERPERIKGVNTVVPPKLDSLDLMAIVDRANKVNGRPYNIWYIDKIITEMYPRIASFATPKPQKAPNPIPPRPASQTPANIAPQPAMQAAPEVAPPPIITSEYAPKPNLQATDQYPNAIQSLKPAKQVNQGIPRSLPNLSEDEKQQAFVEASRAKVLESYANGALASNSTNAFNKQAQEYVDPYVNPSLDEITRNSERLAA